jgi:hypothetical protein
MRTGRQGAGQSRRNQVGDHITRYDRMPIPAIDAQTEYFEAGNVRIGVEYRVLTEAVAAANRASLMNATGDVRGNLEELDDCGVSLHVFGLSDGEYLEYLRFDCFQEEPHYHYVGWSRRSNELLHIDPVADGDPLAWALDRIRTRLPQMFERAGAPQAAAMVDLRAIETIMPHVTEAAYRARFHADKSAIQATAEQPRVPAAA